MKLRTATERIREIEDKCVLYNIEKFVSKIFQEAIHRPTIKQVDGLISCKRPIIRYDQSYIKEIPSTCIRVRTI